MLSRNRNLNLNVAPQSPCCYLLNRICEGKEEERTSKPFSGRGGSSLRWVVPEVPIVRQPDSWTFWTGSRVQEG